jgi:archaellin
MAVAISVAFTLIAAAFAFITYESGGVSISSASDVGRKGAAVAAGSLVLSIAVIFGVSDYLMPPLCRWVGRSGGRSAAATAYSN